MHPHPYSGAKMNYYRYIDCRINEINLLKFKLQKLFLVLNDSDFYKLQELLTEAENTLKRCTINNQK